MTGSTWSRFALDPDEPIPRPGRFRGNVPPSLTESPDVHEYPYLHLFPRLEPLAKHGTNLNGYVPHLRGKDEIAGSLLAITHGRLTYFVYNPWFEGAQPGVGREFPMEWTFDDYSGNT